MQSLAQKLVRKKKADVSALSHKEMYEVYVDSSGMATKYGNIKKMIREIVMPLVAGNGNQITILTDGEGKDHGFRIVEKDAVSTSELRKALTERLGTDESNKIVEACKRTSKSFVTF